MAEQLHLLKACSVPTSIYILPTALQGWTSFSLLHRWKKRGSEGLGDQTRVKNIISSNAGKIHVTLFHFNLLPLVGKDANLIFVITAYLDRYISQRILILPMVCQPEEGEAIAFG